MVSETPTDAGMDGPESRGARKAARRIEALNGPLEPAMQYRALLATLRQETDLLDLADKKARFALVIMGVLNAAVLVLVVRGGDAVPMSGPWGRGMQLALAAYALLAIYYIAQAIEALRPRGKTGRPTSGLPAHVEPGVSMRVLFHSDIVKRSREEYGKVWTEMRMDGLVAEVADQAYMVSSINVLKYRALGRLYQGLGVMTAMVMVMLLTIAGFRWFS